MTLGVSSLLGPQPKVEHLKGFVIVCAITVVPHISVPKVLSIAHYNIRRLKLRFLNLIKPDMLGFGGDCA